MGECPSLSCGSRLAVDKDKLLPRDNYLIWIRIGLRDKDLCNRI